MKPKRILEFLPEVLAFERWLDTERRTNGRLRYTPRTTHTYATRMNRALHEGNPLSVLRRAENTSDWSLALSAVLAWARWKSDEQLKLLAHDITNPEVPPKETKPPTKNEWNRVVKAISNGIQEPQRSALLLLAESGLRIGSDLFHVTRMHAILAQTNEEIRIIQKGRKGRDWTISDREKELLRILLEDTRWHLIRDLFDRHRLTENFSERLRNESAYYEAKRLLHAACAAAGVPYIRPHRFRHAAAEEMRAAGGDMKDIQKLLGHRDIRTTGDYYVHSESEKQKALKEQMAVRRREPSEGK